MTEKINLEGLNDMEVQRVKKFVADLKEAKHRKASEITEKFLELSGTWEDERTTEEIIKEIYESRTAGRGVVFPVNVL